MNGIQDIDLRGKLLDAMRSSGESLAKIAKVSGVNERTLENWVYFGVMPTLNKAGKVFEALKYRLEIVEGEEEEQ